MRETKRHERRERRATVANLKPNPVTRQEQKRVKGGITPQRTQLPGAPVPLPYPNVLK
jgi:hypothetical protein